MPISIYGSEVGLYGSPFDVYGAEADRSSSSSYSTWSSQSSSSSSSESITSGSLSSISSESSPWDVAWSSLFYAPPIRVVKGMFLATVGIDMRYNDALIVQAYGPLMLELGGLMGETSLPSQQVSVIDGWRHTKAFGLLTDAELWQAAVLHRLRSELAKLRKKYLLEYPGEFPTRIRTV